MARLEVTLLVCPNESCQQIGKLANLPQNLKGWCVGNALEGTAHKKERMQPVVFRGQAPEVAKAGAR